MDTITLRWSNEKDRATEFECRPAPALLAADLFGALRTYRAQTPPRKPESQVALRTVEKTATWRRVSYARVYGGVALHLRDGRSWLQMGEIRRLPDNGEDLGIFRNAAYFYPMPIIRPRIRLQDEFIQQLPQRLPWLDFEEVLSADVQTLTELDRQWCQENEARILPLIGDTIAWGTGIDIGISKTMSAVREAK